MPDEKCGVCGERVLFSHTVHVMINTRGEDGVVDWYVCESCYDESLAPLFR